MDNRIITTDVMEEDFSLEGNLRPQTLDEYIGQEKTKNTLKIYIEAAKQRHDSLDHVLFYGPPGLGKTTLSGIIANEMGVHMKVTSGPAIEKPGEMAAILNNLQEGDILFVDEIHRLNRQVEEVLYPAMEDFAIDIMIGKGASARSIRLDLPKFTLVGATTRAGLLSAPLRDRFGVIHHLEFYSKKELTTIIMRSAQVLGVEIDVKGAGEIAMRSRGTPRLANRLLKRVRDFAQVKYDGRITYDVACFALNLLEVDQYGLDKLDRQILNTLIVNFKGGPVGLDTLAAAIGEDSGTLEDVYEPYLLKNGFLNRTPRGRMASALAYEHLGFPVPETYKTNFCKNSLYFCTFFDYNRDAYIIENEKTKSDNRKLDSEFDKRYRRLERMAVKNTAQVIIGGKIITLGGYESEEYFQQVASYMNKKIGELETVPGYGRQPMETKHMLLSLNITDDYFKAKKQVETYELDLQQKDQEMYDLKHELISLRMQIEEAQKNEQEALDEKNLLEGKVKELEKELDEMLK